MAIEDFDQVTIAPAKLRPFSKFIMSIGELPTSYLDSLSYAEQVTWFCDYLQNNVIPALNNNAEALQEVQNLITELQTYVSDYFDNLDVQEEINNKLDEMAEDGSLTNLIKGYIDPIQEDFENNVNNSLSSMQTQINGIASGSPAGIYATVSDLTTADPDHSKIYLVTADGKWYYYDTNENNWVAGGVYQATGVANNDITYNKLNYEIKKDYYSNDVLNNKDNIELSLTNDDFVNGYINAQTGEESLGNTKYIVSRPLYFPSNSWITFTKDESFDVSSVVMFYYDIDGNYISHTTYALNTNFNAIGSNLHPENSAFIRIQIYNSSANVDPTDIQYFTFYYKKSFNEYAKWNKSINLFNPNEFLENVYLSNDNGLVSTSTNYNTSYFIEVEPSTVYTFKNRCRDILEYDKDKKSITSTYINSTTSTNYQYTTNANAKYIRFSYYNTDTEIMLYKGSETLDYIPYKHSLNKFAGLSDTMRNEIQNLVFDTSNILNNKKLVACGDSFTAWTTEQYNSGRFNGEYKTWPFEIGLRNNMQVQNLAVSGSTMATGTTAGTQFADDVYTTIANDADYIIIKYGINDSHQSVPIGTINSNDDTTFYGAWNKVLAYIIQHHPLAKIGIIITNGLDIQNNEENLSAYATATMNIAKKFGIPTLNEWNDPNVPLLLRTGRTDVDESIRAIRTATFRVDESNTHENAACQKYESSFIEDFLRRL